MTTSRRALARSASSKVPPGKAGGPPGEIEMGGTSANGGLVS